jgi:bacterioferritin-associated ferredoxin
MYVCHCRAVTQATVETVIADGARTIAEVGAACGAGTECGGCWPVLVELLAAQAVRETPVLVGSPA